MRQLKKIGLACILLWSALTGTAQTSTFFLVAPTATINGSFTGGQTVGMPAGYSFVQITAANAATFLAMPLPRLQYVYNQLQPGTVLFNQRDKIFNNSDRTVDVRYYLTDDRTTLPSQSGHMLSNYIDPNDNHIYVWPAANSSGPVAGRYTGWVMLGEHQLNADQANRPGGVHAIDEVVLHETSHTQWVGDWTKWGADVSGNAITYGADGMHYFRIAELLGDQEGAINEGLATYYGYTLNQPGLDTLYQDFTSTGNRFFVEGRSVMAGDPILNAVPSRTQGALRKRDGTTLKYPDGRDIIIFTFPWRDIPGFYLLFAESISTGFYSLYWQNAYSNRDTAFSFIGFSANSMHIGRMQRYLTYSCNRLALRMEAYNASAAGQADATRTSSMLPFAILDLVTHFGMSDADYKADYDRQYPDRQPRAYTEYFTNHRSALRTLVQADLAASPIRFAAAMDKIRNYCRQPATIF